MCPQGGRQSPWAVEPLGRLVHEVRVAGRRNGSAGLAGASFPRSQSDLYFTSQAPRLFLHWLDCLRYSRATGFILFFSDRPDKKTQLRSGSSVGNHSKSSLSFPLLFHFRFALEPFKSYSLRVLTRHDVTPSPRGSGSLSGISRPGAGVKPPG